MTLLSVVLVFLAAATAVAQNAGTVSGQVTDAATGEPLTGVQMQVAGTNLGGLTPITSFADALGGRSSGVVMQDVGGTTGTSQRIRIRGANSLNLSNEPLIFLDGAQIDNEFGGFGVGGQEPSRLNDLNPGDIANIEVVKGPAASAMYFEHSMCDVESASID